MIQTSWWAKVRRLGGALWVVALGVSARAAQPPLNMCATTLLDGGPPPGFYYLNYAIFTEGKKFRDGDGNEVANMGKLNTFSQLHQFYYIADFNVLGAHPALDVLVPVAALTARGGTAGPFSLNSNTAGLGDLVVGPALHWDGRTLFGKPVFHRVELDLTIPTGKYSKDQLFNPGSNLHTIEAYYSLVMILPPKWETSWRFFYAHHSENKDHLFGRLKPGAVVHANYALSRQVGEKWRVGAAGYYLQQLREDELNGAKQVKSKERVVSIGPAVHYGVPGWSLVVSHPVEFAVRNRFQGSRTTLQLIHRF